MKYVLLVFAMFCAAGAQAQSCQQSLDCEGLSFNWDPQQGFQITKQAGFQHKETDGLTENRCAVQFFCKGITVEQDGMINVPTEGIAVPAGIADTVENRQQLAAECQGVIDSQKSNSCYQTEVWNADANIYGN